MGNYNYDLFVIGAGSGGVRAARIAAQRGIRVGIAEDTHMGGTCVNVGCVPKKLMVYASTYADQFEDSVGYGWSAASHDFNWSTFRKAKDTEIERLNGIYQSLLDKSGVEVHHARASFIDDHALQLDNGKTITAERILIAVGGRPFIPDFEGSEHALTSNDLFYFEELPKRLLIVGGGYIAVEFACIFHRLGVKLTQLYRSEMFLRGFDDDIRQTLAEQMKQDGIDLRLNEDVEKIQQVDNAYHVTLKSGQTIEVDAVCYATGRVPRIEGLGLDNAGVETNENGVIQVNEFSKTSIDHIYAVGDCTDRVSLTPVAIQEAMAFVKTVYDDEPASLDYSLIPTAVFSQPNIGTVGLTEAEARDKYGEIDKYLSVFRPMKHTISGREEKCWMKLLVDSVSQRVVGCHMLGPDAGEIMQGIGIAMNMGATKQDFDRTMAIHPTAAEEFVTMREKVE